MIRIIDCGSQLTQNIARRVRELGVFSDIVPFHSSLEDIMAGDPEGIIISGGQFSVYDEDTPLYTRKVLESGKPILGICYGLQSITHILGGEVVPTNKREYGATNISIKEESPLFEGIGGGIFQVWMSHGDIVKEAPPGFRILSYSQGGHIAAIQRDNIYAVQFHPEVDHTQYGRHILDNFLNICNATRDWDPTKDYDRIVEETREKLGDKIGAGGISGGIDSTAASVLVGNIVGANYNPIFVDNGLLRLREPAEVERSLEPFNLNVRYISAAERFLSKLKGIVNPDEKRKIIGHEFISVFEEEARKIQGAEFLVQGTLYPDVIESVPVYGSSSVIKRHHNVGGLPEKMGLEVIEPFRYMFKDEVRKIASERLGLPDSIVWRHPSPGPGLAIRIVGSDVTPEKLRIVREADAIFMRELQKRSLYRKISQAFAGLLNTSAVGVKGDAGNYECMIALRAINTNDFMTSDWYDFEKEDITAISNRIINEVEGVNRVVYDVSQKPPATIEWE